MSCKNSKHDINVLLKVTGDIICKLERKKGFGITMKNHCVGDIFEHSFRLKPETMFKYISDTVIFHRYSKPLFAL